MELVDEMTSRAVLGRVSIALCTISPDVAVVTWNVGIADNTDDCKLNPQPTQGK